MDFSLLYFYTIFFSMFELRTNFFSHSNHTTSISFSLFFFIFFGFYTNSVYYIMVIVWRGNSLVLVLFTTVRTPSHTTLYNNNINKKKSSSSWLCFEMVLRKFFDFFLYNNFLPPPNYIYSFNFENEKKNGSVEYRYISFKFDLVPAKTLFEYDVSMVLSWPRIKIYFF